MDVSADRRTAQHLKMLVKEVIQEVQESWGVEIVAVTVDIECLCTLAVLCGTFAVITSAVSFSG